MKKKDIKAEYTGKADQDNSASLSDFSISRRGFLKGATSASVGMAGDTSSLSGFIRSSQVVDDIGFGSFKSVNHVINVISNIPGIKFRLIQGTETLLNSPSLENLDAAKRETPIHHHYIQKYKRFHSDLHQHDCVDLVFEPDEGGSFEEAVCNRSQGILELNQSEDAMKYFDFDYLGNPDKVRQRIIDVYNMSDEEWVSHCDDLDDELKPYIDAYQEALKSAQKKVFQELVQEHLPEGVIVTKKYPTGDKPEGYNLVISQEDGESLKQWQGRTGELAASLVGVFEGAIEIPHKAFKGGRIVTYVKAKSIADDFFDAYIDDGLQDDLDLVADERALEM
ncbi:MAG: twin-arginine translocation signal domain-containing protein [Alphaproteobacteria bacterium]